MSGLYERFDSSAYDDDITTFTALERYVERTLRRWRARYAIARTVASLSQLDARQLHDIGLTFDEIPAAARRAVGSPG
jgi:uncharacterized protein YjiS (DUF1127 family)